MVNRSPDRLDATFAALADPTRRHLLERLSAGDQCVTDLARPYAMSLPAVSKHLRVLEHAGLIERRRKGRVHRLRLEAAPLREASDWIEKYRQFWEGSLDGLARYLENTKQPDQQNR
jgi:DNA-binding transcriptional ArsR family regulator